MFDLFWTGVVLGVGLASAAITATAWLVLWLDNRKMDKAIEESTWRK